MSNATNFFERQDDARRNTSWLVALFAVAVVLVILALSVPLFVNGRVQEGLVVGGVVGAVVLLDSGFRLLQLRGGGRVVAEGLGGRVLPASTRDPPEPPVAERRRRDGLGLWCARTTGMSWTRRCTGRLRGRFTARGRVWASPKGACRLPRDELQGVVAHEFSHRTAICV